MYLTSLTILDSVQFLLGFAYREHEETEREPAKVLALRVGGFPAALVKLGQELVREDQSYKEFVELNDEESTHCEVLQPPTPASDLEDDGLLKQWALFQFQGWLRRTLLDFLSFLSHENIPESIFKHKDAGGIMRSTPQEYAKERQTLSKQSLINRDRRLETLYIESLIQDAHRSSMSKEIYCELLCATCNLLSLVWPFQDMGTYHDATYKHIHALLIPHILRLQEHTVNRKAESLDDEQKLGMSKLFSDAAS